MTEIHDPIPGFEAPVHRALTEPILLPSSGSEDSVEWAGDTNLLVSAYAEGNRSCREVCCSVSWIAATRRPPASAPSRTRCRLAGRKLDA